MLADDSDKKMGVLSGGGSKTLLRLVGKHIVEYTLDNVIEMGAKQVYMVVSNPRDFEDVAVKYGRYVELELVRQSGLGVEGAIISIRDFINDDFILLYGDVVAPKDMYRELVSAYMMNGYAAVIVPEEDTETYSVAKLDDMGRIEGFAGKPIIEGGLSTYVIGGAFVLPREFVDFVESLGNVIEALNAINSKYRLKPCVWSGWWVDIEYPWDLLRASLYLFQQSNKMMVSGNSTISHKAIIEGPVIIEDDVEIDHFAVIKGPSFIGRRTYVGNHSLVRSYVSLEGNNVIGAYTEVVWSSVQKGASIGSRSYIGFSIIGQDSVIEPGVITLNVVPEEVKIARAIKLRKRGREYTKLGAVIGFKARIKAYTVLKPGEEIAMI
ncbi:MAG: NDP-sugar synthase [Ignisphaera sp.]|nr:NDP-sugar synthase [Ignisphaera sp.]MCX8168373.1 NDP-sugar synthase [Ignisphaera sp.]MDW8086313.1 sugar phosphate nucleotidyltransferase [Ignisphaera sp.]